MQISAQLNMSINKWFSATLAFNMIYDDDIKMEDKNGNIGPRLQIKQSLGIGFVANF